MENIENIALEASAGTGKTYNLTVRFIALVLSKENGIYKNISNILAITFTNKASNEMKDRIISSFIKLNEKDSADKLEQISKLLKISTEEVLQRRKERLGEFLSTELKIYTFDAFFGQILRQFSLNVGLMPDFEIDQKLDNKINENYIKSLDNKKLDELAKYIVAANFSSALKYLEAIKKMSLYDSVYPLSPAPDESAVLKAFDELKSIAQPKTDARYQNKFDGLNTAAKIADFFYNGIKSTTKAVNECPFEKEKLEIELKKYYESFKKFKISMFFEHIKEYKNLRAKTLKELNKLDFSDVSVFLYKMLKKDEKSAKEFDINELYFRLDSRITDILIDEFQDTNSLQYEIMMPLIREALSGLGQNDRAGSFFYVGDIKQSIYAFRDAHKDIFEHLYKKKFPAQITPKSLNVNYRSDINIVEYVDKVFGAKMESYKKQEANSKELGYVDISSFKGYNCKEDFLSFEEKIIEKIKLLKSKNVNESDITILCWENKDIIYIKDILLQNGYKVGSKAKKLTELRQIKLVLAYLEYCLFKSEFSKTYLEQFGKKIQPLKIKINEPEHTLKLLAAKLEIDEFESNMLLLYELASASKNIYEFLSRIKQNDTKAHQGASDGINIMTVHSSKGLGFDHCIVCDNIDFAPPHPSVFLSYFDLDKNEWQITLDDKILDATNDSEHASIKAKTQKIQSDEALNKLYVAFTRAKHSLIILCAQSRHGSYPSYFKPFGSKCDKEPVLELQDYQSSDEYIKSYAKEQNKPKSTQIAPFSKVSRQEVLDENNALISINPSKLDGVYFGRALHYAFEMSGDFSTHCVDLGVQASFNKYGYLLSASAFDDIKARVLSFARLKEREFSGFKMYKEQEILYNSKLLRLDLLLVNDEKIVIIDYKSSLIAAANSSEQMKGYIKAVNEIYAKPVSAFFATFDASNNCVLNKA